jgi:hypothetical protein
MEETFRVLSVPELSYNEDYLVAEAGERGRSAVESRDQAMANEDKEDFQLRSV